MLVLLDRMVEEPPPKSGVPAKPCSNLIPSSAPKFKNGPVVKRYYTSMAWMGSGFDSPQVHKLKQLLKLF